MVDGGRVHEVGRHRVAGESCLVDEQHAVAFARQEHGGGRTSAAGADDDNVVHCEPPYYQAGARLGLARSGSEAYLRAIVGTAFGSISTCWATTAPSPKRRPKTRIGSVKSPDIPTTRFFLKELAQ